MKIFVFQPYRSHGTPRVGAVSETAGKWITGLIIASAAIMYLTVSA
jgi:hypothetical protein